MIIEDRSEWYLDLDLVRYSSRARIALVPSVSIEDRPLHWILVRSQTYYPEHILTYGSGKARCSLVWRREWWRSKHHTESGPQVWGLRVQV